MYTFTQAIEFLIISLIVIVIVEFIALVLELIIISKQKKLIRKLTKETIELTTSLASRKIK